jgi:hypothetical protein
LAPFIYLGKPAGIKGTFKQELRSVAPKAGEFNFSSGVSNAQYMTNYGCMK